MMISNVYWNVILRLAMRSKFCSAIPAYTLFGGTGSRTNFGKAG